MDYLWVKALHVISVIAWMAGLLYLPRLFVYHTQAAVGSPESQTFKVMERKLLRLIMNPAMIASWAFGLWLIVILGSSAMTAGWLHGKLALVVLLSVAHGFMARWRKDFERDTNRHTERFFRIVNEVPTLLMIGIVILVIIKPF
ncbi:protoporphyrinogen oxidase HemJ [Defluviicoccus vanus]|uniref:Protoporphyrinogen IX oxidase n=1 Tax=Defluviicoccus vanus TaxID=111831 RepID=A0A7H1N1T6_9PROT|nr:protoporphyrinogen oxidase HemJ [Defluviicoccus vanus]QNT69672.1 protoporphyrinogen oxidase HemJ [Defluviicoccus vanus]